MDVVGLNDEQGNGDAWGNGWVDETMLDDDVEVCVDEGVAEHIDGDGNHWLVNDIVNILIKIFDKKEKT